MFGLEEILLIFVISVIFLSPDNAPALANKIGKFVAKTKLKTEEVQRMIEKELKNIENDTAAAYDIKRQISSVASDFQSLKLNLDNNKIDLRSPNQSITESKKISPQLSLTTDNPDKTTRFSDKTTRFSDKTTRFSDKTTRFSDKTTRFSERLALFLKKDRRTRPVALPPPMRHDINAVSTRTLKTVSDALTSCRSYSLPRPQPGVALLRRKLAPAKSAGPGRRIPLSTPHTAQMP